MSEKAIALSEPLFVRGSCHAQISFNIASPRRAELIIEHLTGGRLLARECRPLPVRARTLHIKTHPEASQITCTMRVRGSPRNGVRVSVDCGDDIEPTSRNFIVIGAMKAGTTTLFELLAQHPALCQSWVHVPGVSFPKEVNYFRELYREGDTSVHYDWRFPFDAAKHAWTLDVSPNYAKYPGSKAVPARIRALAGDTKLAYILREPIDRIESHLAHMLSEGREAADLPHCIRTSSYAMQLDKFTAHVNREHILLLDFEELRRDPPAVMARICDFLQIEQIVIRSVVHNRRGVDFRLDPAQRAELADAVRADVRRLIDVYGFTPAENWLHDQA